MGLEMSSGDMAAEITAFTEGMAAQNYNRKYVQMARSILKRFNAHCAASGIVTVEGVTSEVLVSYMAPLKVKSLSLQQMNWTVLRRFLGDAGNSAFLKLRMRLKGSSRTHVIWLTEKELQTIVDAEKTPREEVLLIGCMSQAMRRCEVLRLTWLDLKDALATGRLRVNGKTAFRVVPLCPSFRAALERFARSTTPGRDEDRLVPICNQRSEQVLAQFRKRVMLRNFGFHALRRSELTRLYHQHVSVNSLARLAGHRHTSQTEDYLDIGDEELVSIWASPGGETTPIRASHLPIGIGFADRKETGVHHARDRRIEGERTTSQPQNELSLEVSPFLNFTI